MRVLVLMVALFAGSFGPAQAGDFDHDHSTWDALLQRHVVWVDGVASTVDYAGVQRERAALSAYLDTLSGVSRADFDGWSRERQLAFLINAYNAFTVELVLREYPDLESIKDIGGWFGSPWKQEFFTLLGERRHLDDVEHGLIRGSGRYDEPRIHVAVVCASIGCPALRPEAFVDTQLERQLSDSLRRFLADRSRNHYRDGRLTVSKIFDWYGEDFPDLGRVFAAHAEQLATDSVARQRIRNGEYKLRFGAYDWSLNDRR